MRLQPHVPSQWEPVVALLAKARSRVDPERLEELDGLLEAARRGRRMVRRGGRKTFPKKRRKY